MGVGSPDPCVYPLVLGIFKGFRGNIDVFLHGTCQSADRRPGDGLGNLHDRIEISRTGNRETSLYDIDSQLFKSLCHLDFLHSVELAPRHLLAITQSGVKNEYSV